MAKIPMGNFSQPGQAASPLVGGSRVAVTAESAPAAAFGGPDLSGFAAGADSAANTIFQREEQQRKEIERQDKQNEERALRTRSLAAGLAFKEDAYAVNDALKERLAQGEIGRDAAQNEFTKSLSELRTKHLNSLPAEVQGDAGVHFDTFAFPVSRDFATAVSINRRQEVGANVQQTGESLERLAARNLVGAQQQFAGLLDHSGPAMGLGADEIAKRKQSFNEKTSFTHAASLLNGATSTQSSAEVRKTIAYLSSPDAYPDLDPEKRRVLIHSGTQVLESFQRRAEIEAERRAKALEKTWEGAVSVVQAGKMLSPEYAAGLLRKFKGTPYEKALGELVSQAPAALSFSAQPVAAQESALFHLQAKGNTAGWSPAEQKQYEKLDRAHKQTLADIKDDPYKAALERGILPQVAPLNPLDFNSLPQQLATRAAQADTLRAWTGREVSPLRPEEAKSLAEMLNALPAPQRAKSLNMLGKVMTPPQMQAMAADMGESSIGVATLLAARDLRSTSDRLVSEIYLKGVDAVRDKRITYDESKQNAIRQQIHKELDGVYASAAAARSAAEAVFGIYNGLKSEGESPDIRQAVRLATGGIMTHNGGKIAKPHGWSDGQVRDAVAAWTPEKLKAAGVASALVGDMVLGPEELAKALPSARLSASPVPNAYTVIIGNRQVMGANRRPLLLPLTR